MTYDEDRLVSPYDWAVSGGVNNHMRHLAEQFMERGHDVARRRAGDEARAGRRRSDHDDRAPDPAARQRLRRAHHALAARRRARCGALLDENEFDIVHVHEPFMPQSADPVPALLDRGERRHVPRGARVELLLRCTGGASSSAGPPSSTARSPSRRRRRSTSRSTFPATTTSSRTASTSSTSRRTPRRCPSSPTARRNVLFVGRPEKRKGLRYLLRAFVGVQRELPDSAADRRRRRQFRPLRARRAERAAARRSLPQLRAVRRAAALPPHGARLLRAQHRLREPGHRPPRGDGRRACRSSRRTSMASPASSRTASRACSCGRRTRRRSPTR